MTVTDPSGNNYTLLAFNINQPGVTSCATVEGLAFVGGPGGFPPTGVPLRVVARAEGPNVAYANLTAPICFASGARIATPQGARPIEQIAAGDLVQTRDDGAQPVPWAGRMFFPAAALIQNRDFAPIRVMADSLGPGWPARDVVLSPQHRIPITG